jgi:uncharacterized membrane protein (UPF0127 family)
MKLRITNRGQVLCANCEVADTEAKRRTGLLAPCAGDGLMLPKSSAIHTHGMKFGIDVVFLDQDGLVLDCLSNVRPGGNAERDGASSVLELPAGTLQKTMTAAGDYLDIQPVRGRMPDPFALLNLAEQYGLVQPGTTVAVSQLREHAQKVREAFAA